MSHVVSVVPRLSYIHLSPHAQGKSSATSGDMGSAQMHTVLSIVCSILSALSVIVGLFFIALITVASIALQEAEEDYDYGCYNCTQ